jgi:Tat protein secretion system quality control protein TatD with DNase activity
MLVDTHCHLDVPEFDADRDAVIARARAAGVTRQIVPAIEAATWPALRDACARDAGLFPAYGLHPLLIERHRDAHLRELRDWIERERPVAVGECGLDYYIEGLDPDTQAKYFEAQLHLARDFDLPDTLLLETDAPDQPDADHRGQRNEPARIVRVLEVIAALRGEAPDVIARATTRNAETLFSLPESPRPSAA